jgi:short-subunit dehydrogenase
MPVSIENQIVLVVGASRVMASARREARLRDLQESSAGGEGRTMEIFAADAADASQMENLAQHTHEHLGEIDILGFVL